jgi:hypothetical protein
MGSLTTTSVAQIATSQTAELLMKEELEWMCNEGVVAKLKALSQYLS